MLKKLVCILTLLVLSNTSLALSYTKKISAKTLQKQVTAIMPITQKTDFLTVTLTNPIVELRKGSDKVAISTDISANGIGGIKGSGTMDMAGNVVYNSKEGAIYLQNIEILKLSSSSIGDSFKGMTKTIAQQLMNTALKNTPIYRFSDTDMKAKIAKATLKSIRVKDEKLELKMKVF